MKAIWQNETIAESTETIIVEGNHYFPPKSVHTNFLKESKKETVCPWKGTASYYSVDVNGNVLEDAAWYYPTPKDKAENIKGYVAFWKGVKVTE